MSDDWLAGSPMDPLAVSAEPLPAIAGVPFAHAGSSALIVGATGQGRSSLLQVALYDAGKAGISCAYLGSEVTGEEFNARAATIAERRGDTIDDELRVALARVRYLDLASVIVKGWALEDPAQRAFKVNPRSWAEHIAPRYRPARHRPAVRCCRRARPRLRQVKRRLRPLPRRADPAAHRRPASAVIASTTSATTPTKRPSQGRQRQSRDRPTSPSPAAVREPARAHRQGRQGPLSPRAIPARRRMDLHQATHSASSPRPQRGASTTAAPADQHHAENQRGPRARPPGSASAPSAPPSQARKRPSTSHSSSSSPRTTRRRTETARHVRHHKPQALPRANRAPPCPNCAPHRAPGTVPTTVPVPSP